MLRRLFVLFLLTLSLKTDAQKVGLVLSGGGARGLAHIGAIRALEEAGIPIDYIAGTSAGAIVGCMYAVGYSPHEMDSIVRTEDFYNWANGILDENYYYYYRRNPENASWVNLKFTLDSMFQTSLPTNLVSSVPYDFALLEQTAAAAAASKYDFDSLFVPFRCVAADIENKQTVVFRKGDLGQAVRASSAYPFYFRPIIYDNKILYDGGLYNNFPADIMLEDFQPDLIIGVNASGKVTPMTEGNIISQIRAMMTTPTKFSVICENSILIEAKTDEFGLFDFTDLSSVIEEGYRATREKMDSIAFNVHRRVNADSLREKRRKFRSSYPEVVVDRVSIEGVNSKQAEYVRRILKPGSQPIPLARLKASYFQLVSDPNIRAIQPKLTYQPATGLFDLHVRIQQERDLITQFGGVISSRPISEVFAGITYNIWSRRAWSFNTNFYFGKLYTSGQARIRMDAPFRRPFYLEADATLNQYDFFRSSNAFFSDQKPAYIVASDYFFGLHGGFPARNKGKVVATAGYLRIADNYYQTQFFLQKDTADKTILKGFTGALTFERSTLNRKQFANQGTFLQMRARIVSVDEDTRPGSTSSSRVQEHDAHQWLQAKLMYENYYKRRGRLRLGFYTEVSATTQPFFNNYTATVLNTPSFEPILETQTLFLPVFRAQAFGGAGVRNVIMVRNNLELRVDGYVFQPYRELIRTAELKTRLGEPLAKRYFLASGGLVLHSPIGPISLAVNYYDEREPAITLLFHAGFLLFHPSALD
jgi:NTE family protein